MKRVLPLTAGLLLPVALIAQDTENTDRDRSMIVGFLEDNLSGAGRDIRIEGFKGLLSSTATMEELTIADETGVWFTLRNAELDWSRTALLAGRVEVTRIAAEEILFERLPETTDEGIDVPDPEATPFALPDLPVSIDIGAIEAERVRLGAPVLKLGEAVELSLTGSAKLADGSGETNLQIERIDSKEGQFAVVVSYDNDSDVLDLDISLNEGAGGLISTLGNLPGSPPLSLTAQGAGPLVDFTADIALATHGEDRLTGQIALRADPDPDAPADTAAPRRFSADLSGDLTPLFSADYAQFFGPSSTLTAAGVSYPEGGFELDRFALSTRTLSLVGSTTIGADGWPSAFSVSGTLESPDDRPVLLPFGESRSMVQQADIVAKYDVTRGQSWSANIDVSDYAQDGLTIASARIGAQGTITQQSTATSTALGAIKARFGLTVQGLASDDPALQASIGDAPALTGEVYWREGEPFLIQSLEARTDATRASASGQINGFDTGFEFTGTLGLDTPDLSRFAALSGLDLAGATSATAKGSISPLNGTFDIEAEATGTDLRTGIEQLDALIGGSSDIRLSAKRDETGMTLRPSTLKTAALDVSANGALKTDTGALNLTARLDDVSRLGVALSGPLTLEAEMAHSGADSPWNTRAVMNGPGGSTATLSGTLAQDMAQADLDLTGSAPLGLSNRLTSAALTQGTSTFNLGINGPLALSSVSGQVQVTPGGRIVISSAGLALTVNRAVATLNGEQAQLDFDASADTGGSITASGQVGLSGALPVDLTVGLNTLGLSDPQLYETSIDGDLSIAGSLTGAANISGALTLGETNITIASAGLGSGGDIPDILHRGAASGVTQTRDRAGLIQTDSGGGSSAVYGLDVTVAAPNQIFVRGRGLDAELGGRIRVRGTTADVIPVGQFSLIRGRLSLLGKRITMEEGSITLQGELDPILYLVAETETDTLTVQLITEGPLSAPELTLSSSPELPDDEILAQLLFGKDLSEMSALQAAQMADAVATLAGGGSGLVGSIRDSFGLDDLDLQTTEEGASSLKVGKYISDSLYTDVSIDNEGKSEINLNFDATDNITLKGSASSDGDTGVGVFFERDY
ncbi:translocation/assembly module TamB domain-containing protein [Celeribacter halophilus]|uniref:Translocation/assembly module TamB domain-containing protein n=1 Tax=Celeribacter halophilus TaxID=576117 RepID=A0AAW7XRR5_9RHOB|nr:translocation/assembly module TamB domain-containing protein [Celeribacter halophilus]MDO6456391.1 translocation/assembly module TamB domain-containing protein [Celeribacter halophilus]MDO6722854.1 translocation/assembly module TamB domain-containing protein [Celeribacter halophilus]